MAYFCMEYGLDPRFHLYAGGLGILAGDHLKGARDMGLPLVGIGVKWKQGYGRQLIAPDGQPMDGFRNYDYDVFLEDTGVEVTVQIKGSDVQCKVWKTEAFGNAPLYLLDTDLPDNPEAWTTGRLYGGTGEDRVAQEIVLGVGGVRALRALGIGVDVYHFNEGHALLAAFELIREKREAGLDLYEAAQATRQEVVFTTHTPVPQGNESHPIERFFYLGADMGLTGEQLEGIGGNPFNMTVGALRLSRMANGVAQLHGETANRMWADVDDRAEIRAITNGIHRPTWVDKAMLDAAADEEADLWVPHQANKRRLIEFIAERTGTRFDENKLLIGFARRAVAYKRANLIFSDEARIGPLLESGRIQLVFSGKSHPLDDYGKELVAEIVEKARQYPNAVAFLPDYNMTIGALLTRGADVWLNNPRRPKEASGTSGMKAAMNGVLNVSILDGWWPEACEDGVNGWQLGDGFESEDEAELDAHDREALYDVVLGKVVPTYYDEPEQWQAMMRASIQSTREAFSVERMLREYIEQMYRAPSAR